jgi:isochorismate synthase
MIEQNYFFEHLASQLANNLPFVAYRKPNDKHIKLLMQEDDNLNHTDNYEESGFLFAPFSKKQPTLIIPYSQRLFFKCEYRIDSSIAKPKPSENKNLANKEAKAHHLAIIQKGIGAIKSGSLAKVVLSRKLEIKLNEPSPIELFKNLLATYATAFCYIWHHPKVGLWLGASPETLLKIDKNSLHTMALAGTQAYTNILNVKWGSKEINEQQLVTDFLVSGLKDTFGSKTKMEISDVQTVKAAKLLHLKTDIQVSLKEIKAPIKKLIQNIHPTPAVCGFPSDVAKEFILHNEGYDRTYYTGFMGELNFSNSTPTQLFVNLRCMQITNKTAIIYVGGGITQNSIAEKEWEETENKAKTMLSILDK